MDSPPQVAFDVSRLDHLNTYLLRDGGLIAVAPKTFAAPFRRDADFLSGPWTSRIKLNVPGRAAHFRSPDELLALLIKYVNPQTTESHEGGKTCLGHN